MVEAAQLMVPQREVAIASFHIGAGPLEHLCQLFGLLLQCALLCLAQLSQRPTGLTQRRAQTLGQLPKRLACIRRARLGPTIAIEGRDETRVQGVGHRRWPAEVTPTLCAKKTAG